MARSSWKLKLFGTLTAIGIAGGMSWVLWAQSPASESIAPPPLERYITVGLSGQRMRCKVIQSWATPSGGEAYRVSVVESGETLTVVRETAADGGKEMPVRIFRWTDATTSPVGAPMPPAVAAAPSIPASASKVLTASDIQEQAKKAADAIAPPPVTQVAAASPLEAPSRINLPAAAPLPLPTTPEISVPVVPIASPTVVAPTVAPLPVVTSPPLVAAVPPPRMPIIINGAGDAPVAPLAPVTTLVAQNTQTKLPVIEVMPPPAPRIAAPVVTPPLPTATPPATPVETRTTVAEFKPNINYVPPMAPAPMPPIPTPIPTPVPASIPAPIPSAVPLPRTPDTITYSTAVDPNGQAPWAKGEPLVIPGKSTMETASRPGNMRPIPNPIPEPISAPRPLPKEHTPAPLSTAAAQPVSDLPTPRPTIQPAPPVVAAPSSTVPASPKTLPPPTPPQTPREVIALPASRPTSGTPAITTSATPIIAPPPAMPTGPDLGTTAVVVKETIIEVPCDENGKLLPGDKSPFAGHANSNSHTTSHKPSFADLFSKKPAKPNDTVPCTTCPPPSGNGSCSTGTCNTGTCEKPGCPTGACGTNGCPPLPNPPGCNGGNGPCTICPGGAAAPPGACAGQVPVARVVGNKSSIYDRIKGMFSQHKQPANPPAPPTLIGAVPYGVVPNVPYETSGKMTPQPLPAGFDRTAVAGSPPMQIIDGPKATPAGLVSPLAPLPNGMDRTRVAVEKTPATASSTLPGMPESSPLKKDKTFVVHETPTINAANSSANKPKTPFPGLTGRQAEHPAMPVVAEMPATPVTPPESQAAKASRVWQTGMVDPKLFSNGSRLAFPAPAPTTHPALAATPTIDQPSEVVASTDRWKGLFYLKRGSSTPSTPMTQPMGYPYAMPGAMMPMNAFHNVAPPTPFNAFPVAPAAYYGYGYPAMPYAALPPVQPVNYEQAAPGNPSMDRPFSAPQQGAQQGDRKVLGQLLQTAKESPHPSQREWAVMSLATFNVQAHPHLISFLSQVALNDPAGAVRASAVNSLKRMNVPPQTIYTTLQSLRNDSDVRVRTAVEEACEAR